MKWIKLKDKKPKLNEKVLVYKTSSFGSYSPGIYLGIYHADIHNKWWIVIDEKCETKNNYRSLDEFSHWQRLPKRPSFQD